jgi:hypothetical protein
MKPRERMLAIGVAALVGLLLLNAVYQQISGAFTQRNGQKAELEKKVQDKQRTIEAGRRAEKLLVEWRHRSLPSNKESARSQYNQWLVSLVDRVKLESPVVDYMPTIGRSTAYDKFGYRIKGDGDISMKQLIHFLYEFYNTNQLHQIRQLTIKPKADGKQMELTIDVEAMQLPGADRPDKLNLEPSNRLKLANQGAYEKTIGDRNLFVAYTPPRTDRVKTEPPKTVTKQPFDIAKFAKVTGIVEDNNRPQIWVSVQTNGELLKLTEGEDFTVGDVQCKVVKIGVRDAVVTVAGKQKQVKLEDNLRDAAEMPTDEL